MQLTSPIGFDAQRRDGYNETETLQLLSQTHLNSPGFLQPNINEMQRIGQFIRYGESHMVQVFPPQFSSYQVSSQFSIITTVAVHICKILYICIPCF